MWLKRLFTSATVLLILGLLVWILFWDEEKTPVAILSVQSHPFDVNFVIPARPASTLETGILGQNVKYLTTLSKGKNRETALLTQFDGIDDRQLKVFGGPDNNVILMFIAAQGVVNSKGEPCFLDMKSEPFDEETWTPLKVVFKKLVERIRPARKQRVVVFIDSGVAETDWPMGWLQDDFRDRLKNLIEADADFLPKQWQLFHVRGAGDLTTFANTGRRVLFADVLICGLLGSADGANNNRRDQRISLREMIEYVTQETGVRPDIWPKLEDERKPLNLCWTEKSEPKNKPTQIALAAIPNKLTTLWDQHHSLDSKTPWRLRPWEWARFEWLLLRAERAWLVSDANFERILKEASLRCEKLIASVERVQTAEQQTFNEGPEWERFFRQLEPNAPLGVIPDTLPQNSPAAALAFLLNRDVLNARYSAATKATNAGAAISKLIRLRRTAESDVWKDNFRAEAVVRYEAETVDSDRRALEDLAFVGGEESWAKINTDAESLMQKYAALKERSVEFAERLAQRDKLFAKLPWMFRRADVANAGEDERQQLITIWNDAADALQHFENRVSDKSAVYDWSKWENAWKLFDKLNGGEQLAKSAEELSTTKRSNREWVREVIPFLATPLVSGNTRIRLLNVLSEVLAKMNSDSDAGVGKKNADEDSRSDSSPFSNWTIHPTSVMYAPDSKAADEDDRPRLNKLIPADRPIRNDLWQAGGAIRKTLKEIRDAAEWSELLRKQPDNSKAIADFYKGLVKSDGQGRALAVALCAGEPSNKETPDKVIVRLDQFQAATYYEWRARRAVLDFYGPTESNSESFEPFYKRDANFWIKRLRESGDDGRTFLQALKNSAPLLDVKTSLLELTAVPSKLEFLDGNAEAKMVEVTMSAGITGEIRPTGAIAVEVPKSAVSVSSERERVGVNELIRPNHAAEPWKKLIAIPPGSTPVPVLAFFRGHSSLHATVTRELKPIEIPIERDPPSIEQRPRDATVFVKGRAPQKLWLMVILDCSYSMEANNTKRENVTMKRFDVAKEALVKMLKRLQADAEDGQVELHVGLMAYGYRVGIADQSTDPTSRKFAPRYADPDQQTLSFRPPTIDKDTVPVDNVPKLSDLDPSLDVGTLVSLQSDKPWNRELCDEMVRLVNRRQAVGCTPLYLSLAKAARDMRSLPEDDPKSIVLLTDGVDNQETLTDIKTREAWGLKGAGAPKTGREEAEQQLKGIKGLSVKIVAIGIPTLKEVEARIENTMSSKERDELVQIQSGIKNLDEFCKFKDVNNRSTRERHYTQDGETLAQNLMFEFAPVAFQVTRTSNGERTAQQPTVLGSSSVVIQNPMRGGFQIEVIRSLRSGTQVLAKTGTLTLIGGENLELLYVNKDKKLEFHRGWESRKNDADKSVPDEQRILRNSDSVRNRTDVKTVINQAGQKWQAALLAPKLDGRSRRFRVGFRPEEPADVPERPELVRAVLTPLIGGETSKDICPYFFESKDAQFEPRQSIPVLEFVATNWKAEWTKANLSVWLQAPGDVPPKSTDILVTKKDLFEKAGDAVTVAMSQPGAELKFAIGKRQVGAANDTLEILVNQEWINKDSSSALEKLPILQVEPSPRVVKRKIYVESQQVKYTFAFPADEVGRTAYQLRILDPATLPEVREQQKPVKQLRWEKIDVE